MHLPVSSLKLLLDVNCVGWSCWNFLLAVPAEAFAVVRVRRRWNDWLEKAQVTTFGKVRYRCHFPPLVTPFRSLKLWKSLHFPFMASVRKSGKPSNSPHPKKRFPRTAARESGPSLFLPPKSYPGSFMSTQALPSKGGESEPPHAPVPSSTADTSLYSAANALAGAGGGVLSLALTYPLFTIVTSKFIVLYSLKII